MPMLLHTAIFLASPCAKSSQVWERSFSFIRGQIAASMLLSLLQTPINSPQRTEAGPVEEALERRFKEPVSWSQLYKYLECNLGLSPIYKMDRWSLHSLPDLRSSGFRGTWVVQLLSIWLLISAHVVISGSWDWDLHQALHLVHSARDSLSLSLCLLLCPCCTCSLSNK